MYNLKIIVNVIFTIMHYHNYFILIIRNHLVLILILLLTSCAIVECSVNQARLSVTFDTIKNIPMPEEIKVPLSAALSAELFIAILKFCKNVISVKTNRDI